MTESQRIGELMQECDEAAERHLMRMSDKPRPYAPEKLNVMFRARVAFAVSLLLDGAPVEELRACEVQMSRCVIEAAVEIAIARGVSIRSGANDDGRSEI